MSLSLDTYGAYLTGVTLSTAMYGITCAQVASYYWAYRDDNRAFKGLVGFIWMTDSLQQALLLHSVYFFLVICREKGDLVALLSANWLVSSRTNAGSVTMLFLANSKNRSMISMIIPGEISISLVECYFIWRTLRFWKTNYILFMLIPLVSSTVGAFLYIGKLFRYPSFNEATRAPWEIWLAAGSRVVTDVVVAAVMSYKLYTSRRVTLAHRHLLTTLTNYTIATGVLSCVFAITYLITYIIMPFSMFYVGVYCVHTKIYVNSMMATLNSRQRLREMRGRVINVSSDSEPGSGASGRGHSRAALPPKV
ncbi:hypothetical protein OE88DRAFT_1739177 [Heliocybe sulcata]|uniref:DUF6534 domain-containing protein n=1 Tax=Heliocybe sulcata TaxID=5364 RepID=A0A5C3MPX7_9AGAM|nr:hypothetical protein OE88DRAFT_1739177 [Heliocybe sulcata]